VIVIDFIFYMTIEKVKKQNPIILCLTNNVVMNFTANVLLASGFSPIMSLDSSDIEDLSKICNGILINIGTINQEFIKLCEIAIKCGIERDIPIVFDPVGSGVSKIRTNFSRKILNIEYENLIIKGNASEILSLYSNESGKGVDSAHKSDSIIDATREISNKYNKIICITGENDCVIGQNKVIKISNGSEKMTRVTGMGCALGAIIAGFTSSDLSINSISNAVSYFGIAGEIADEKSNGIGDFQIKFLDALSNIDDKIFEQKSKIYEI